MVKWHNSGILRQLILRKDIRFYLRETYPSGHEGTKGFLHPNDAAMQRLRQVRHLFRLTFRLTKVMLSWMQGQ